MWCPESWCAKRFVPSLWAGASGFGQQVSSSVLTVSLGVLVLEISPCEGLLVQLEKHEHRDVYGLHAGIGHVEFHIAETPLSKHCHHDSRFAL